MGERGRGAFSERRRYNMVSVWPMDCRSGHLFEANGDCVIKYSIIQIARSGGGCGGDTEATGSMMNATPNIEMPERTSCGIPDSLPTYRAIAANCIPSPLYTYAFTHVIFQV